MSDEFGNDTEGIKSLREALEKANKALTEANESNAKLAAKDRTRTIAEKLAEYKISPKVAKFVDADVDPDKLEVWITENADVFGFKVGEPNPADAGEQAAQQRVAAINNQGPGGLDPNDPDLKAVQECTTADQLANLIYNAQMAKR